MCRNIVLEAIENANKRFDIEMPVVGSMVKVSYRVEDAGKSRKQVSSGIVVDISKRSSIGASFSIYKPDGKLGVLKKFLLNSPLLESIEFVRGGKVRRAKLGYIIGKFGKSARVKNVN